MSDDLYRLPAMTVAEVINGVPVASSYAAASSSSPADAIRAAIAKLKEPVKLEPPQLVLHPHAHDDVNDVLGRPHGTPVTYSDVCEVLRIAWDEAGETRLLAASFGVFE